MSLLKTNYTVLTTKTGDMNIKAELPLDHLPSWLLCHPHPPSSFLPCRPISTNLLTKQNTLQSEYLYPISVGAVTQ